MKNGYVTQVLTLALGGGGGVGVTGCCTGSLASCVIQTFSQHKEKEVIPPS